VTNAFSAVAPRAERGDEQQVGDLSATLRVVGDGALAVGLGSAQERGGAVLVVAEGDGVAAALAHLGPVGAEQNRRGGEQRVGLTEDRCAGGVALVEAPSDQPRELDVRELVSADRHEVPMAELDVGGLVDRIRQEQGAQAAAAAGRRLGQHQPSNVLGQRAHAVAVRVT
jgi:hypothetical protein